MNLSRAQLAFQTEEALRANENFTSLYAHILAYHTNAQRNAERLRFVSCGFLLNVFDAEIFTVTGLNVRQRHSQTIAVLPKGYRDAGTLFIPPGLSEIITDTYRKLNAGFQTAGGAAELTARLTARFTARRSGITIDIDEAHRHVQVWVYKAGADFPERIAELCADESRLINLYLNMKDENAVKAYEVLLENGFFFIGIHPLSGSGEFIVMHNPLRYKFDMAGVAYIESQTPFVKYIQWAKESGNEKVGD